VPISDKSFGGPVGLKMNLFQLGNFTLASGKTSRFKIECDNLTDDDWECLAWMLFQTLPSFGDVKGVPTGGLKLAEKMEKYRSTSWTIGGVELLIVDDVYTTGGSINAYRLSMAGTYKSIGGAVVFARSTPESWIESLFVCSI